MISGFCEHVDGAGRSLISTTTPVHHQEAYIYVSSGKSHNAAEYKLL